MMPASSAAARRFVHVHSSGRFDRPLIRQTRDVRNFITFSDLITMTEQNGDAPRRALSFKRALPATWDMYYPVNKGNKECATFWDAGVFSTAAPPRSHLIADETYYRAGGAKAPIVRAFHVPLLHKSSGRRVDVLTMHMPLDNTDKRADTWLSCASGLRALTRSIRKQDPNTSILLTGDWNKNFRQANERAIMARTLATPLRLRQSWTNNVPPKGGTHGPNGLIDQDITDLIVRDCDLLKDTDASDHRPYRTILQFA